MSNPDANFNVNNQQVVNQNNPYQQYYQEYSSSFNQNANTFGVQSGNVEYAGFGIRLLAWLIDFLVLLFLSFIIGLISGFFIAFLLIYVSIISADSSIVTSLSNFISGFIGFSVNLLYFTLFWSSKFQGTPGKILLGLKIVDANGNKISYSTALIRYISTIISSLLLGIGYLLIIFDGKKQALHDKFASTYVIKVKK